MTQTIRVLYNSSDELADLAGGQFEFQELENKFAKLEAEHALQKMQLV